MRRARPRLLSTVAGMAVCPAAVITYLAFTGALGKAADDLIWFASHHYAGIQHLPFARFAKGIDAVTVALFPVAFLMTGVAFALKPHGTIWREPHGRAALALAVVGLLGAFPRPDVAHLSFAGPLGCPLVAVGITHVVGRLRDPARIAVSALVIGLCIVGAAYATKRRLDVLAEPLEIVATPKGVTVRRPGPWTTDYALLMWHLDRLPTGDPVFFYPYLPMLPYLTGRQHPAALDVMVPGYNTADQFRETCARVVREARWLIVDRTWSDPRKLRELFPTLADYDPPEKRAFESAMARAFDSVAHRSSTFELRRRGSVVPDTMCGGDVAGWMPPTPEQRWTSRSPEAVAR